MDEPALLLENLDRSNPMNSEPENVTSSGREAETQNRNGLVNRYDNLVLGLAKRRAPGCVNAAGKAREKEQNSPIRGTAF